MPLPASSPAHEPGHMPVFATVMAGGKGTRLWPLSREAFPKQFLALKAGGRTLLQEAVRRAAEVVGALERVLVVAQVEHATLVRHQLPELPAANLILEPMVRNTAACIGLAAMHVHSRSPQAVMAVFPADHLFVDERPWVEAIREAINYAGQNDRLVTIGIPPASPSPNYGYLHLGRLLAQVNEHSVYEVQEFVEKPGVERSREFCESGEYLWNTGTFAWQVSAFQNALASHLPELYESLGALAEDLQDQELLRRVYPNFENISVDYGVMEKSANVAVVRGDFQRIDVGTLATLSEVWPGDDSGNAVLGELANRDSRNNIVYSDQGLVGLIGLENMIVIRQGDVLLVCPKDRAPEVKQLVAALSLHGLDRYR